MEVAKRNLPSIQEEWRPVLGYEKIYEVSNIGRIRSLSKMVFNQYKTKGYFKKGIIRKQVIHRNGYCHVMLSNEGKTKLMIVHRLVCLAFVKNYNNKPEVNHINGIKTDNRVENLEWCTRAENEEHSLLLGLKNNAMKVINVETGIIYDSIREAAFAHNIKRTTLNRFLTGYSKNKSQLRYLYGK